MIEHSSYPRPGYRIAPQTLSHLLDAPLTSANLLPIVEAGTRLKDLDASVWERYSSEICREFAHEVIRHLSDRLFRARHYEDRLKLLPCPPQGLMLSDLALEVRTRNRLTEAGFGQSLNSLHSVSVGDLLVKRNFGVKALVDFLTSLEHAIALQPGQPSPINPAISMPVMWTRTLDTVLTAEAHRLRRAWNSGSIRVNDPRFEHLSSQLSKVTGLTGATLGDQAEAIANRLSDPPRTPEATTLLQDLRRAVRDRTQLLLHDELADLVQVTQRDPRNVQIVLRRFGWDGQESATLQAIAEEYGLTRERVRQIVSRTEKRLFGSRPFAPALTQVIDRVIDLVPRSVEDIEDLLHTEGFTASPFCLGSIAHASSSLYGECPFRLVTSPGSRLATSPTGDDIGAQMGRIIRKRIQNRGVMTVADLLTEVGDQENEEATEVVVRSILDRMAGIHWLDEDRNWFWLATVSRERNRLLNQIEKVLAVAERISVTELRPAISRRHRLEGFGPPQHVLLRLCELQPEYVVDGDIVAANQPMDWEDILEHVEETFVRILQAHGPVMSRIDLEDHCLAAGMNRSTFYVYLDHSPVITKFARGVYGLVGTKAVPEAFDTLLGPRRRSRIILDVGWTTDQRVWIAYRVSESSLVNGVISVPAGAREVVSGRFDLQTGDGASAGTLVAREGTAWGLGPFFRRRGGDAGDILLITFDPRQRTAVVELGSEALIDDLLDVPDDALS